MSIEAFLQSLIGKIFKILPMREQLESGEQIFLEQYLATLAIELSGACITFPELSTNKNFITIINTVNGINTYGILSVKEIKCEVFKMINLLEKLKLGEEYD